VVAGTVVAVADADATVAAFHGHSGESPTSVNLGHAVQRDVMMRVHNIDTDKAITDHQTIYLLYH
jgi:hypothetical protein